VGVATQDPTRVRALDVEDKSQRVCNFQKNTVTGFNEIIAALGLERPEELNPSLLMRRIGPNTVTSYAQLYDYLEPGELLSSPPEEWKPDWERASVDRF
jgi:hypothetical protein